MKNMLWLVEVNIGFVDQWKHISGNISKGNVFLRGVEYIMVCNYFEFVERKQVYFGGKVFSR